MRRSMETIGEPLTRNGAFAQDVDSVATILERESESTIKEWLARVNTDENLFAIKLDDNTRSSHLPQLFKELVHRLRYPLPLDTRGRPSKSAHEHGLTRRKQGYSAAMLVEESRMLEVSIFDTLHKNDQRLDSSALLLDVMVIADEVDLQLAEAMTSFIGGAKTGTKPKDRSIFMAAL
jgi:hypothetical protein